MLKEYSHNPPHLFLDDQMYFVTAACYQKQPFLMDDRCKQYLLDTLRDFARRIKWHLEAWVILDDHYHVNLKSKVGKDLSYLFGNVHRKTAKFIRGCISVESDRVWWNYWDYCPRNETDYFKHLNYLLYNPVKHGCVDDLKAYRWSSFNSLFQSCGHAALNGQFKHYGYRDLSIDFEDDDLF